VFMSQDVREEGGGEGKKDAEESLMVCTDCIAQYYRGRLAPIVMLPKEFAGTIIKITRSGIIKGVFDETFLKFRSPVPKIGEVGSGAVFGPHLSKPPRRGRSSRLPSSGLLRARRETPDSLQFFTSIRRRGFKITKEKSR